MILNFGHNYANPTLQFLSYENSTNLKNWENKLVTPFPDAKDAGHLFLTSSSFSGAYGPENLPPPIFNDDHKL